MGKNRDLILKNSTDSRCFAIFVLLKMRIIMDTTLQGIHLDIPQSDMSFFMELVKKMGWKATFGKKVEGEAKTSSDDALVDQLYGSVHLPVDFDYKKELAEAINAKYK